jgi:hypothetical protein
MYDSTIAHDKIISAFTRNVPDCYVRDYRENNGWLTICRGYRDVPNAKPGWSQTTVRETLCTIPRGNVKPASSFMGAGLIRPGWRLEFRKAAWYLTENQKARITKDLGVGQVFR